MERCRSALKLIRANQNKVPKMKFQFTSTRITASTDIDGDQNLSESPMAMTAHNVDFNFNSTSNEVVPPIKQLPEITKEIVKCFGMDSDALHSKIRAKEVAAVLSKELVTTSRSNVVIRPTPSAAIPKPPTPSVQLPKKICKDATVQTVKLSQPSVSSQTEAFQCEKCLIQKRKMFVNKSTQIFPTKKTETAVQTDEEDYREPIVELLSHLTAAQLVAVKDFATIVMEPRPQSSVDMFKVRERMMDVYNLSQRDADAVRIAQQNRLDDPVELDRLRYRASDIDYENERNSGNGAPHMARDYDDGPSGNLNRNYDDGSGDGNMMRDYDGAGPGGSSNSMPINNSFQLFGFQNQRENDEEIRNREYEIERRRQYEERRQIELEEERLREEMELRRQQLAIEEKRRRQNDQYRDDDRKSFHGKRGVRGAFRNNNRSFRGRGARGRT